MKVVFGINYPASNKNYLEYARVAIHTARQVGYDPVLLYDGDSPPLNVEKIYAKSRFADDMKASMNSDEYCIASGAMLRLEIPLLFDDEYILYTDLDVTFRRKIEFPQVRYLGMVEGALTPAYRYNSGVSIMNTKNLREVLDLFDIFCRNMILNKMLQKINWDEGLLNFFFGTTITNLPKEWNWRPYWGKNINTAILHFHGPKPLDDGERILACYPGLDTEQYRIDKHQWEAIYANL